MNKIAQLMLILSHDEDRVSAALNELAEQHADEHDLFHVARELAGWSDNHGRELARVGERYGLDLLREPSHEHGLLDGVAGELEHRTGTAPDEGMVLLRQLRELHLVCVGLSVDWEMLAQAAKSVRDDDLLGVAESCQSEAARQMKWANSRIKESAPQIMAS